MTETRIGKLALVPVPLAPIAVEATLPAATLAIVRAVDFVFAESPKSARAFLKSAGVTRAMQSIAVEAFDATTTAADLRTRLAAVVAGRDAIVVSEAGAPGVADPGARLVRVAHQLGIQVLPCVGPSAILLALMASGMEGQRFAFHGYLPVDSAQLGARIKALEHIALRDRATQIFIETPYRNDRLLAALLNQCEAQSRLAVAADLTASNEWIRAATIAEWRRSPVTLGKRPAVFLIGGDTLA